MPIRKSIAGSLLIGDIDLNKRVGVELRAGDTQSVEVALFNKSGIVAMLDDIDDIFANDRRSIFITSVANLNDPRPELHEFISSRRTSKSGTTEFKDGDLLIAIESIKGGISPITIYYYDPLPRSEEENPFFIKDAVGTGMWCAVGGRYSIDLTLRQSLGAERLFLRHHDYITSSINGFSYLMQLPTISGNVTLEYPSVSGTLALEKAPLQLVAGEAITATSLIRVHTDGKAYMWKEDMGLRPIGIAISAALEDEPVSFITNGNTIDTSGLSAGVIYYGSSTGALVDTTVGLSVIIRAGVALNSTTLLVDIGEEE